MVVYMKTPGSSFRALAGNGADVAGVPVLPPPPSTVHLDAAAASAAVRCGSRRSWHPPPPTAAATELELAMRASFGLLIQ